MELMRIGIENLEGNVIEAQYSGPLLLNAVSARLD
jgi:hypothetical protein